MSPEAIYVAPLSLVGSTIEDARVSHLVTLINGETMVPTPPRITPDRHLRLDMNDICEPALGLVLPCEGHVANLVQFALDWDRKAPLLIHCWAGISRSTAAAFIRSARSIRKPMNSVWRERCAGPRPLPIRTGGWSRSATKCCPGRAHGRGGRGHRPRRVRRGGAGVLIVRTARGLSMPQALRAAETVGGTQIELGLNAAIVSVRDQQPQILVVRPGEVGSGEWDALPFGPFAPREHRTLEIGLRAWVKQQTGLDLGYVEQLYTFGDRGRHAEPGDTASHVLSVGYLALTRGAARRAAAAPTGRRWYGYFPWEDWRAGQARDPRPRDRAAAAANGPSARRRRTSPHRPLRRAERLQGLASASAARLDEEKVLERYELLYEAGLVAEARARRPLRGAAMGGASRARPADGVSTTAASSPPPWGGCAAS